MYIRGFCFYMNAEQNSYIENNIELITGNDWDKFFKGAPQGVGGVLHEAGIDFMTKLGYVPSNAFYGSEVQTVVIPDSVTSIGSYAFCDCYRLTSVNIGKNVTSIGNGAFYDCNSLTQVIIPNGVTILGHYVFSGCSNLTSITIPNSITAIGDEVFFRCGNIEISYNGTTEEWNNVVMSPSSFRNVPAKTITCSNGTIKLRH